MSSCGNSPSAFQADTLHKNFFTVSFSRYSSMSPRAISCAPSSSKIENSLPWSFRNARQMAWKVPICIVWICFFFPRAFLSLSLIWDAA